MTAILARTGPMLTGDPADPIDRLMFFTRGEVLRVGVDSDGGEYDPLTAGLISTGDRRRVAGARLVSASGTYADALHEAVCEYCPQVRDLTTDEFVAWYYDECLAGLDYRASDRAGTVWHEQEEPTDEPATVAPSETHDGTVPAWATEWHARLLHEPKRALLAALIGHRWQGAARPTIPRDEWARKMAEKFDRKAGK